jgi:hypothetical protein
MIRFSATVMEFLARAQTSRHTHHHPDFRRWWVPTPAMQLMNDTAKMPRPKFPRNPNGPSGRVEHDSRGNAIWKRTRASDTAVTPDICELDIIDDSAGRTWDNVAAVPLKPKRY